jgi:hypothetical protein
VKDPKTVLDAVRAQISPNAKLLVVWVEQDQQGAMRCAQVNLDQAELAMLVESLRHNLISTRLREWPSAST